MRVRVVRGAIVAGIGVACLIKGDTVVLYVPAAHVSAEAADSIADVLTEALSVSAGEKRVADAG